MNIESERAAFEAAIEASGGMRPGNYSPDYDRYVSERVQGQYEGWKLARAALTASAPSHGEQVRGSTPRAARKTWLAGNPSYLCHNCNTPLMMHEKQVYCPEGPAFASNSTTAPSAGNQGGDV